MENVAEKKKSRENGARGPAHAPGRTARFVKEKMETSEMPP